MRKSILLLMALCLHVAARGQTEWRYQYWFDNDRSTLQTGTSASDSWQLQADVSHLSETFHAIHLQVCKEDTLPSIPVTRYFVKTTDSNANYGRYWFDDDVDHMYTSQQMQGVFDIDVSPLAEGFHSLHYQVVGHHGIISATATRSFFKTYIPANSSWRCWFDNDYSTLQSGKDMSQTLLLDVSQLSDGYHVLHIQVDGGAQSASTPLTKHFVKIPQTIGVDHFSCLFMVDDKVVKQEQVDAAGGVVEWDVDVSTLSQGFHRFFVQVVTPSGAASNTYEGFFLRATTNAEFAEMKCVYAIDGAEFYTEAGTLADGTYHFDLDVSALDDGLHRITYMLNNGKGVNTKAQTQFFMKTPLGGNGITEYWYWLNEEADSIAQKVVLPERTDPFSLITLLPVKSQPIRSSLFQFRIEQDQPVIYAKNDIHLRFYDASGRFTDATKQFVDESVKQEVEPVGELQTKQTFPKIAENDIRWYTIQVAPGDTVAFRLSQAATLQVFAPSGKEVFKTSESASVQWGGIHTWEEGTYYIAVHDVTGNRTSMTLDYMHMDKYDVVEWDVHTVGNGGCSTITFKGNGFNGLYSVDLYTAAGDSIHSVDISHESDAETAVTFDFSGTKLGKYDAVFHFADEDKLVSNVVTVEEAVDNLLITSLHYANQYLMGSSNVYTLQIENKGNMTAYEVPILLYVFTPSHNSLSRIDVSGYNMEEAYRKLLGEYYSQKLADSLSLQSQVVGDLCLFNYEDNMPYINDFPHAYYTALQPNIRPGTKEKFFISVKASTTAQVHIWVPDEWTSIASYKNNVKRMTKRSKKGCSSWDKLNAVECINRIEFNLVVHPNMHPDCDNIPPDCPHPNGSSTPRPPVDPNDIYGYLSDAGSKFMTDDVAKVNYTIEFENDTTFAQASAHTIAIRDTLDSRYFDLKSFLPTSVKIGEREVFLDETADVKTVDSVTSFLKTIDMRPEINAIAQVEGEYSQQTGIGKWTFTSLDPMTMEPTNDLMQGILPVNYDGTSGIGEVIFEVGVKSNKKHGTEVNNRAGIVFDYEEPILTPTWTNVIDRIAPVSHVTDIIVKNDSTAQVLSDLFDGLSGPWRYDVYVQYGEGSAWWKAAENVPVDSMAEVRIYEGINHGFYVVLTDSAGNMEQKEAVRECTLYNGEVATGVEEAPVAKNHGISFDGTLLSVRTECGRVQQVNVVSMAGQTIVQVGPFQNGTTIDLSRLPSGAYTVTATGCGEKLARKIVLRNEKTN